MPKDIIHFAHANGFPAKIYERLFSYLENAFEIGCLERHAHNPKFPVSDGWRGLVLCAGIFGLISTFLRARIFSRLKNRRKRRRLLEKL